jgi:hypothetical protein
MNYTHEHLAIQKTPKRFIAAWAASVQEMEGTIRVRVGPGYQYREH